MKQRIVQIFVSSVWTESPQPQQNKPLHGVQTLVVADEMKQMMTEKESYLKRQQQDDWLTVQVCRCADENS